MRRTPGMTAGRQRVSLSHRGAVWVALFVTLLWSSSWVLIRWGLEDEALPPITFAALRYGLAAAVLVAWVLLRRRSSRRDQLRLERSQLLLLVLLGMLLYALTQGA